jgi:hypothetical protein
VGSCRRLTIKDRAGEKHQELDEQVLLLRGDLVPAEALPPVLDITVADALLDIGIEPLFGYGTVLFRCLFLLGPELW